MSELGLSRRDALSLLSAGAAGTLAGCSESGDGDDGTPPKVTHLWLRVVETDGENATGEQSETSEESDSGDGVEKRAAARLSSGSSADISETAVEAIIEGPGAEAVETDDVTLDFLVDEFDFPSDFESKYGIGQPPETDYSESKFCRAADLGAPGPGDFVRLGEDAIRDLHEYAEQNPDSRNGNYRQQLPSPIRADTADRDDLLGARLPNFATRRDRETQTTYVLSSFGVAEQAIPDAGTTVVVQLPDGSRRHYQVTGQNGFPEITHYHSPKLAEIQAIERFKRDSAARLVHLFSMSWTNVEEERAKVLTLVSMETAALVLDLTSLVYTGGMMAFVDGFGVAFASACGFSKVFRELEQLSVPRNTAVDFVRIAVGGNDHVDRNSLYGFLARSNSVLSVPDPSEQPLGERSDSLTAMTAHIQTQKSYADSIEGKTHTPTSERLSVVFNDPQKTQYYRDLRDFCRFTMDAYVGLCKRQLDLIGEIVEQGNEFAAVEEVPSPDYFELTVAEPAWKNLLELAHSGDDSFPVADLTVTVETTSGEVVTSVGVETVTSSATISAAEPATIPISELGEEIPDDATVFVDWTALAGESVALASSGIPDGVTHEWERDLGTPESLRTEPAADALLATAEDGRISVLSTNDGSVAGETGVGQSNLTIETTADGFYVGQEGGIVRFDWEATPQWRTSTNISSDSRPELRVDGANLYAAVGLDDGQIASIQQFDAESGTEQWYYRVGDSSIYASYGGATTPFVESGTVYAGLNDTWHGSGIYALDADGVDWQHSTSGLIDSMVRHEDTLVAAVRTEENSFSDDEYGLFAVGLDGTERWSLSLDREVTRPIRSHGTQMYVLTETVLRSFAIQGVENWRYELSTPAESVVGPVVVAEAVAVAGATEDGGHAVTFVRDGESVGEIAIGEPVSGLASAGERVYVWTDSGTVHAFTPALDE
ncbi:PQQ-binding-like beta-propeller repeat protein [Halorussus litoreus]|uniref:hypothetical protein n=1 Tax=Halorussus litoreus TaxID=1710536 RepID=UPI001300B2B7|nr:hypothetical protein [Halorussus litoreus]